MARYIDKDLVILKLDHMGDSAHSVTVGKVMDCVEKIPTADVRPNVRGEWVEDELGTTVCSNCKNPRRDNRIKHIAFCNSCGADMRGEE